MDEKKKKSRFRGLMPSLLALAVIGYIAVRELVGVRGTEPLPGSVLCRGLGAALGLFCVLLLSEWGKYALLLKASGQEGCGRTGLGCAVLGKYYDNITPAGCGGQPFQMAYLAGRGCPDGLSGAIPIAGFLGLQLSMSGLALGALLAGTEAAAPLRMSAWAGLGCYSFLPVCILLFTAAPGSLERMIRRGAALLHRVRIVKDADTASERALSALEEYRRSLMAFRRRPALVTAVLGLSLVYRCAMSVMPWAVLRAMGVHTSLLSCAGQVLLVQAASAVIPTPGNAGAAEASFYAVFSALSPSAAFWAMLFWRLGSCYAWLLCGGASLVGKALTDRRGPDPAAEGGAAQFIDAYYPHVDGVVKTVHAYGEHLPGSAVFCPGRGETWEKDALYRVVRVPMLPVPGCRYGIPLPGLSLRARRYLRRGGFGVFHAHSPFVMGRYALRMGKRLGVPVAATFHSKYYDDFLSRFRSRRIAELLTRYVVRFYERADEVWACSAATADTLRSYGFRGEIRVMDNGVEPVSRREDRELRTLALHRFDIPLDRPVLLFVGQLIWQKNLRLILDTCALMKRRGIRFTLLAAGEGPDGEAIRRYARSLGLEEVRFLGQVRDRSMLRGLYLSGDLLFFPSLYDNAPLVLREAAREGLPALLTRGSNAAECVRDGWNGYLEPPEAGRMAERIRDIFSSEDRKTVGERARGTIPVPWTEIARRVDRAYGELSPRYKRKYPEEAQAAG